MSEENQSYDFLASEGEEEIISISLSGFVNPPMPVTCGTAPSEMRVQYWKGVG